MQIDYQTLERLSNLELRQYTGDLTAIVADDRVLYNELMESPVEVRVTAQRGLCEGGLYEICLSVQGRHKRFVDVRHAVINKYTRDMKPFEKMVDAGKVQSPCLLTVLFDGIYVGDSEDLFTYRNGVSGRIWYPTKGLGEKIAEIVWV